VIEVKTNPKAVSFPSFLARENTEFVQQQIQPDWSNKTATFNFIINKKKELLDERNMLIDNSSLTPLIFSNKRKATNELEHNNSKKLKYAKKKKHQKTIENYYQYFQKPQVHKITF
jgi:hypothetical protein